MQSVRYTEDESLELEGDESLDVPYVPVVEYGESQPRTETTTEKTAWQKLFSTTAIGPIAILAVLIACLALVLNMIGFDNISSNPNSDESVSVGLEGIGSKARTSLSGAQSVDVNGNLNVNGSIVLDPTTQPKNPQLGSIYIDKNTAKIYYYNGTAYEQLMSGGNSYAQLQAITDLTPQAGNLAVTGTLSAGSFVGSGNAITNINAANVTTGILSTGVLPGNGAITILAGSGLSGGGTVALGATTALNTIFGSIPNTSVQGNTSIVCSAGTGNLTGGGNSITLGSGGSCAPIGITDSPTFAGTLSAVGVTNLRDLIVTGGIVANGSTVFSGGSSYGDYPVGGVIGAPAATVDIKTSFVIMQTTPGQVLDLPVPTNASAGRIAYVLNTGVAAFTMHGVALNPNTSQGYIFNGSVWVPSNIDGAGSSSGVSVVGPIDSQVKSANGATISGQTIYMQSADVTSPGIITTGGQIFAGVKTFNSGIVLSGSDLTIGNNNIITGTATINGAELSLLDGKDATLVDTNDAVTTAISGVGTIASGTWQGTAIADSYVSSNVSLLNATQTYTGAKTFTGGLVTSGTNAVNINAGGSTGGVTIGNSVAGAIAVQSGSTITSTSAGTNTITTADVISGNNSANVNIYTGSVLDGDSGSIFLRTGQPSGIGTSGSIYLQSETYLQGAIMSSFTQAGSGTFSTASGNVSLNGNTTVAAGKLLTATGGLQVGSATTDASANLLVLDSYNNGSDPAGVSGSMYYNTNLNKFRCYEGGAWTNCSGNGITAVGALDGGTANANAAYVSGGNLYLQSASVTYPGVVNVAAQTFAGVKTFNSGITIASGQAISITGSGTRPSSPTEGMVYFDTTTHQLITYANGKWQADKTTTSYIVAANDSAQVYKDAADYVGDGDTAAAGDGDQVQINTAITAAGANGGTIYLAPGTYMLDAPVSMASNIKLSGSGATTVLKAINSYALASSRLVYINGVNNTTVENLLIDGNTANQANSNNVNYLLQTSGTTLNTKIINVDFINADNYSLYIVSAAASDTTIINSRITSASEGYALTLNSSSTLTVDGTTIVGTGTADTVYISNGTTTITNSKITTGTNSAISTGGNTILTNNTFSGSGSGSTNATVKTAGNNLTISGNRITNTVASEYAVFATVGTSTLIEDNLIISGGIASSDDDVTISGNNLLSGFIALETANLNNILIQGNRVNNAVANGIYSTRGGSNITIDGNIITNSGSVTASSSGISFNSVALASDNIVISNNSITDTAGTGYAISITSGYKGIVLANNQYGGTGAASINDLGSGTIYSSQRDANGRIIIKSYAGMGINTATVNASLQSAGSFINAKLTSPAAPTLTRGGSAGSTSYGYAVSALDGSGETLVSATATTNSGNATLDSTNYNIITISPIAGALSYKVYRVSSAGTPSSTGLIGTVSATAAPLALNDTGLAATTAVPSVNSTGSGVFEGSLSSGTPTYAGTLRVSDGSNNYASIVVNALAADNTYTIPTTPGNDTFCLQTLANCGSTVPTLQTAYDASTNPEIVFGSAATAGLTLRDNATPIAGNLLEVQNNAGSTTFFGVTSSAINLNVSTTVAAGQSLRIIGSGTRPASPTEGMVYFDTSTHQLITYANGKWQADRTTATKIVAASNSTQAMKDAADYVATGTGDQVTLNTAFAAAAGGKVYLAEGTYSINGSTTIPSNTTIAGAGYGTLIQVASTSAGLNMFYINDDSTNITIQDLRLDGNRLSGQSGNQFGIYGNDLTNMTVKNTWINNFLDSGVYFGRTNGTPGYNTITNNSFSNNGRSGNNGSAIKTFGSHDVISDNNSNNDWRGVFVTDDSQATYPAYTTVTGNTINDPMDAGGIDIFHVSNITITGNTVTGQVNISCGSICANQANYSTITGNNVSNSNQAGINVRDTNNSVVSGNNIRDAGSALGNEGVYLSGSSSNNNIVGNIITDNSCTANCYAIDIAAAATNNYLADNRYTGPTAQYPATINDAGTNTRYASQMSPSQILQSSSSSIRANASSNISGTSATNGTTTLTGTTTYFTTELQVGDRITANAQTRTVTAIASNTSLTVDTAFVGTGSGYTVTRLPAILVVSNSAGIAQVVVKDDGSLNVWSGTATLGTSTQAGSLRVSDGSSNYATVVANATAGDYTYTIPTTTANDTFCLVTLANCSGAGASVVGALDGGTANANGATISANTIYLQSASATYAGLVNTTTQTIAGNKTFTGATLFSGNFGSTPAIKIQASTTDSDKSLQVLQNGGNNVLVADANNTRVGIGAGAAAPNATLQVAGTTNIAGGLVNVNASSNFDTNINTGTSTGIVTIGGNGFIAKNTNNSATAFQVQNASSASLLNIDTSNSMISLLGNNGGETAAWSSTTAINEARAGAASASYNGYIYIIGGFTTNEATPLNTIRYGKVNNDGTISSWALNTNNLPVALDYTNVTVGNNGYIYVLGGSNGSALSNKIYYAKLNADGSIGSFTTSSVNLPASLKSGGAVVYNGYLYYIGGQGTFGSNGTVDTIYYSKLNGDGTIGSFTTNATALPAGRGYFGIAIANGYFYTTGSFSGPPGGEYGNNNTTFGKFNADGSITGINNTSTTTIAAENASTFVANGYLYSVGGGPNTADDEVYYAKINSDGTLGSYTTAPAAKKLTQVRIKSSYTQVGNYMYVLGGVDGTPTTQTTVYYTTVPRVTIGGGLDLVSGTSTEYSQGGAAGALMAGNTQIVGTLNVQDSSNFIRDVNIGGQLSVNGASTFKNNTNSTNAFQIQNAAGTSVLNVDTTPLNSIITNPSFEETFPGNGWAGKAGTTPTQDATQSYSGVYSAKLATTATANTGLMFTTGNGTSKLSTSTNYKFSFYTIKTEATAFTDIMAAYSVDGTVGAETSCTGINTQTVTTNVWTRHDCVISTTVTAPNASAYIIIKQVGATAHNFFIDGIQIEANATESSVFKSAATIVQGTMGINNANPVNTLSVNVQETPILKTTVAIQAAPNTIGLVVQSNSVYETGASAFQYRRGNGSIMYEVTGGDGRLITGSSWAGAGSNGVASAQFAAYIPGNANTVGAVISGSNIQTQDLLQVGNRNNANTQVNVFTIGAEGATLLKNRVDSTSAFQIQNASAASLVNVDTTNSRLTVGSSTTITGTASSGLATGTSVTKTSGSASVSGVATAFQSELRVGDKITISGETRTIIAIASNTALTVDSTFGSSATVTPVSSVTRIPTTLTLNGTTAASDMLFMKAASSQSGYPIRYQDSNGLDLFRMYSDGSIRISHEGTNSDSSIRVENTANDTLFNVNTNTSFITLNGTKDAAGNLLQDGSFEGGSTYTWTATEVVSGDGIYNETANARTGNRVMKIAGSAADIDIKSQQWFAVTPGDTVYFEGYVKAAGGNGDAGIYLEFRDKDKTGGAAVSYANAYTGTPGASYSLKNISTAVSATACGGNPCVYARPVMSKRANATAGTYYFDDMYFASSTQRAPYVFKNTTNSTTAFQIQNNTGASLLTADTANKSVSVVGDMTIGSAATMGSDGRLFSDNFESGSFAQWDIGKVTAGGSAITTDTTIVRDGKYSMKNTVAGANSWIETHIAQGTTYKMRGYFYVSSHTSGDAVLMGVYNGLGTTDYFVRRNIATGYLAFYNANTGTPYTSSTVMSTGAWHEVELDVDIGAAGAFTVYLDGVNVVSGTSNTSGAQPDKFFVGDGTSSNITYYVDDLAVDTVRPGASSSVSIADSLHIGGNASFSANVLMKTTSNSAAALQVQNAAGASLLTVNTLTSKIQVGSSTGDSTGVYLVVDSYNGISADAAPDGAMYYDSTNHKMTCRINGAWVGCNGPSTNLVSLIPEFTGGLLKADGTNNNGSMTSDFASGLSSGEGYKHNYYEWTTSQATSQDYDIVVNHQLPSDFNATSEFDAGTWKVWTYVDSNADAALTMTVYDNDNTACANGVSIEAGTTGWNQITLADFDTNANCDFTPGSIITIVIHVTSKSPVTNKVRVGEIQYGYTK